MCPYACTMYSYMYVLMYLLWFQPPRAAEMIKRDVPGFAIGGLSGGEDKNDFWRMVTLSTDILPKCKPRYLMGVG